MLTSLKGQIRIQANLNFIRWMTRDKRFELVYVQFYWMWSVRIFEIWFNPFARELRHFVEKNIFYHFLINFRERKWLKLKKIVYCDFLLGFQAVHNCGHSALGMIMWNMHNEQSFYINISCSSLLSCLIINSWSRYSSLTLDQFHGV